MDATLLVIARLCQTMDDHPKPMVVDEIVETAPPDDSPDMRDIGDIKTPSLPVGFYISYRDTTGADSVRRVTALGLTDMDFSDPCLIAFCHLRQETRAFRLDGIRQIVDPYSGAAFADPLDYLVTYVPGMGSAEDDSATLGALFTLRHPLNVLVFFARCDGYLHLAERGVIADFVRRFQPDIAVDEDTLHRVVQRLTPDVNTMMDSARTLAEAAEEPNLATVQAAVRDLIEADGEITDAEQRFAMELAYCQA